MNFKHDNKMKTVTYVVMQLSVSYWYEYMTLNLLLITIRDEEIIASFSKL